ncbi:signal peptidase II [uncultured Bifidobacterium sp.]|uniref:signal peptidase II n=1 Tax=uncultured Bifidobacterium sp. TaxID=165187 RepID=UPI002621B0B9|nr:signal peptidase II [uncultured Bifidobacterium sp.]
MSHNLPRRPRVRAAVFACLSIVLLAVDQSTKIWAQQALAGGESIRIMPGLSLTLVRNPGATLGLGSSRTWLISLVAILACVGIVVLATRTDSLVWTIALAMGFAGALGNLIDRIVHATGFMDGKVVDFLDYGWSVGNVADIALMGAGVLIVIMVVSGVPFTVSADADAGRGGGQGEDQGR